MESVFEDNDLGKVGFGGIVIGSTCGGLFGLFEGIRLAGLKYDFNDLRAKLGQPRTFTIIGSQVFKTMSLFSIFFAGYQVSRFLLANRIERTKEWEKPAHATIAAIASAAPLMPSRTFRANLPYACVLVGLDIYNGGL